MEQPTKEHVLKSGWKATIITYFTQGQFEQVSAALTEGIEVNVETQSPTGTISASRLGKANDAALALAVRKLVAPDGTTYEGDALTLDVIKSLPFDPDFPSGELLTIINDLTKKKAPPVTSSGA